MKNLFLACLIALSGFMQKSFAQNWVNIPDSVFANVLANLFPNAIMQNGNNYFLNSEDSAVVSTEYLFIRNKEISNIEGIHYFSNLLELFCDSNSITNIPTLPPSLVGLWCSHNSITSFPLNIPNTLQMIDCSDNQISEISYLPSNLSLINCSGNNINNISNLPLTLKSLFCSSNQLNSLPVLPPNLITLWCTSNNINQLPLLPNSLENLGCSSNNLNFLPPLPQSLILLYCQFNNISCFPFLSDSIQLIQILNNPFSCLPNYISSMSSELLEFPLCNDNDIVNNPNSCVQFEGISGYVYKDIDQNCSNSNFVISNVQVQIENTTTQEIHLQTTLANGSYFMSSENGDFLIRINEQTLPSGLEVYCPTSNEISASINTSTSTNNDFGLVCSGYDLGTQSVHTTGWVFPGQVHQVHVNAGDLSLGLACAPHVSGDIHVSVSGPVGSISFPNATSVQGNTATYSVTDFQGIISDITFVIQTDTLAQTDDEFCVNVSILNTEQTDSNPQNDIYTFCYSVINSYDPNVKLTSPELVLPGYQDEFTYTIYFQNTGNAPAFNIRIEDVLDQKLDVNTFRAVAASHHFTSSINTSNRKLTVRFPAIMLPDSTSNAEESIGFIQYKVKPIQGLQEGTKIYNTASIFFDYNEPIVTNTTENLFSQTASVQMNELVDLKMFPNPTNKLITFSGAEVNQIKVTDVMGKIMFVSSVTSNQVSVEELENGVYFIELETSLGIQFKQLVVQKH